MDTRETVGTVGFSELMTADWERFELACELINADELDSALAYLLTDSASETRRQIVG